MAFEKDPNELGVLWAKTSARGDYMTGSLEIDGVKQPIVVFRNGNKRNEKSPDFRILKATPREKLASADEDAPF
jgi:uncharacterized protein (DUF736 family)